MKWHLDEDAAALLHTMTGTDDEPTPVTLFVGESLDDDGKPVYGLHAYESEYPEEGCMPLVEFARPAPAPLEAMQQALDALTGATSETYFRDPRGDRAGLAIDALRAALAAGVEGMPLVMQCSKCFGSGKDEGANCRRCFGKGTYVEEPSDGVGVDGDQTSPRADTGGRPA